MELVIWLHIIRKLSDLPEPAHQAAELTRLQEVISIDNVQGKMCFKFTGGAVSVLPAVQRLAQ